MESLLTFLIVWIVASIPASLLVARFLAGKRSPALAVQAKQSRDRADMLERTPAGSVEIAAKLQ